MDAARNANPAERLAPRDRIRLSTARHGHGIRSLGPPADVTVNLFLKVDERLFHDAASISCDLGQSKRTAATLRP